MSKKILFFGNEKLATGVTTQALAFKGLIEAGYEIPALIVSQRLDKEIDKLEVVKIANEHQIAVKSYPKLVEAIDEIVSLGAEAAVLAAYGKIVPKSVIDLFSVGIINIHPSLLPKHRGSTPIESAILAGDMETGVSLMKLLPEMDAGPIYSQQKITLTSDESKQQLADSLDSMGKRMLLASIEGILSGDIPPTNQPKGATYDQLITKDSGRLDWDQPWVQIERLIRAYSGWPGVRFKIADLSTTLLKAHFEKQSGTAGSFIALEDQPAFFCQDGLVVIDELLPEGRRAMSGSDFMLGYGQRLLN